METPKPAVKSARTSESTAVVEKDSRSDGRLQVRPGEIVALEEQRRAGRFGLGICEAITEIQLRRFRAPVQTAGL
jgi:hypothetical protein